MLSHSPPRPFLCPERLNRSLLAGLGYTLLFSPLNAQSCFSFLPRYGFLLFVLFDATTQLLKGFIVAEYLQSFQDSLIVLLGHDCQYWFSPSGHCYSCWVISQLLWKLRQFPPGIYCCEFFSFSGRSHVYSSYINPRCTKCSAKAYTSRRLPSLRMPTIYTNTRFLSLSTLYTT